MPELPDIIAYLDALAPRILGLPLERARVTSPFLLRTAEPPLAAVEGKTVTGLRRLGKRIVWEMEDQLFLVFHLMIAGRFKWRARGAKASGKISLATFEFPGGALLLTEASKKHRASLHVVRGKPGLAAHDPGGLDVLTAELPAFRAVLQSESHTLKRALTDPRLFDGIGNAYSDEILHAARLSPFQLTGRLADEEIARLHDAARRTLLGWIERLRSETGLDFPEKVTAFRDGMAVHGRYKQPCPVCGSPVQRIRYAENEANYCATCQTGGRVLADRALSRLLEDDWPRSLEEWETRMGEGEGGMKAWIATVMTRELKALRREVESYPGDADLWRIVPGIANPGGNLVLHLAGNIQYFFGTVLGGTGYVRHRDAEFGSRDVPRADLLREIDGALAAVETGLARVSDADLGRAYPQTVGGVTPTTGAFLTHLAVHLAYHLGQVDYHRRIVTGEAKTVGALATGELRP